MAWTRFRPSRNVVFGILLALSALALKLPRGCTDPAKHITQHLVPFQDAAYSAARNTAASLAGVERSPEVDDLTRQRDALAQALQSQYAELEELRAENQRLSAIRKAVMPEPVPLQSAKVVGRDIVASREALLIGRGDRKNVADRDWVASRFFVDKGSEAGLDNNQMVFSRESLLGRVEQVSPYMARVQLLSDLDSPRVEVRVGAVVGEDGRPITVPGDDGRLIPLRGARVETVDYVCSMRGRGQGRMVIEDVPYRYLDGLGDAEPDAGKRRMRVGDWVFSAPNQFGIPVSMIVGKVVEIKEKAEKRLVGDVIIAPAVDLDRLVDVYVIPASPTPVGGG